MENVPDWAIYPEVVGFSEAQGDSDPHAGQWESLQQLCSSLTNKWTFLTCQEKTQRDRGDTEGRFLAVQCPSLTCERCINMQSKPYESKKCKSLKSAWTYKQHTFLRAELCFHLYSLNQGAILNQDKKHLPGRSVSSPWAGLVYKQHKSDTRRTTPARERCSDL